MLEHIQLMIAGEAADGVSTFEVLNPATEEVIACCPSADSAFLDDAVSAAREAFPAWAKLSISERRGLLLEIAGVLEQNKKELARILTLECGKPSTGYANTPGSIFEVEGTIAWCRATAELDLPVNVIQDDESGRIEAHRRPLGVVGSITPWNAPLLIAGWHVFPALLAGNTVVLKPSEFAPVAALRFVELVNAVLPPGVVNSVAGDGSLGASISSHPDIQKVIFTGSTATGKNIMASAAGNLKRLTLELGGNDAAIVLPDVDVNQVAQGLFLMAFTNSGQVCAAMKRLYVHEDIYDKVCDALVAIARSVNVVNDLEESDFGPLQNKVQFEKVKELAKSVHADGGKFLIGGEALDGPGYFFPISIVTGLDNGSRLVDEEPFGPILPIMKFSDVDEVVERCNQTNYGLGGSVWSADEDVAVEIASRIDCGTVWINKHGVVQPNVPYGGIKESGYGVEFGDIGLREFTVIQVIFRSPTS